jgi:malate dehydrogenase
VVTNPLDVICIVVLRETGFAPKKVIGQAGVLDSTRFCYFTADAMVVWPEDVMAMVLGAHGDSMVPLPRYTSVGSVPITELLDDGAIEQLVARTRTGGGEIIVYLKTGSAYYASGALAARIVESVGSFGSYGAGGDYPSRQFLLAGLTC